MIISALFHRAIVPASEKVAKSRMRCNLKSMANVTKSDIARGMQTGKEIETVTPAEAERVLVRRAQQGDATAYEDLVRIHQHRVLAVVGGILRGSGDVEDVAQQALAKAYFSIRRFDLRSAFGTWLYKIAVNECWDYLRKKKVRRLVYEADLSEEQVRRLESVPTQSFGGQQHLEDAGRQLEQRQLVEGLLSGLEEKDQLMLVMKEVEGFSVEEIGEVLGLNVNTVKVRLFRARGRVVETYRKRMQKQKRTYLHSGLKPGRSDKSV
jgi:RNA polymerase sigma-70 factor, ECF subfamily